MAVSMKTGNSYQVASLIMIKKQRISLPHKAALEKLARTLKFSIPDLIRSFFRT